MSYSAFQELLSACYLSRREIEEEYNLNPIEPYSYSFYDYTDEDRITDATNFLDKLFQDDDELNLEQISSRILEYRRIKEVEGPIWSTIGNVSIAIAKAASYYFRDYGDILPERPDYDLDEILLKEGKPSPYGDKKFPNFAEYPEGDSVEGSYPIDYQAVSSMYDGNLLALLIAREYDFEEILP